MRKSEIVRRIAEQTGLTYTKAEDTVEVVLREVKAALSEGDEVILRRFGTFSVRAKAAREGRNPKTGAPAGISARCVVRFKPGSEFKAAVQGCSGVSDEEHEADEPHPQNGRRPAERRGRR